MAVVRRGMEPIEAVLRYPTRREDWVKTLLIGGVLTLFSVLVVPAIVVSGYVLAVIRGRTVGEQAPPGFGDWGTLFVDGLKTWVVGVVYAIIPVAVGLLVFGGAVAAFASGTDAGVALGLLSLGIGSLVWLVVALAFFYPFPHRSPTWRRRGASEARSTWGPSGTWSRPGRTPWRGCGAWRCSAAAVSSPAW